ncbi:MAG: DUF1156 domain-containing protein [Thermoprotei archaeon]|nr:MAG: DUF1156 domain-containing protein [Thermoprotei archaeon]
MKPNEKLTFIETPHFPIEIINEASAKEKGGGGRPPHWEMVFWWTRKPLAGARAVIAGALLTENIRKEDFTNWLRLRAEKTPHRLNPWLPNEVREEFKKVKLLDPFAGFGSIPLEAIRLGVGDVVAVEFLPTAYIFLKAVLEYPKTFSNVKVRISGKEVKRLRLDSIVTKLTKAKKIINYGVYDIPSLIYDIAKWGAWIVEKLREDQDIKELYDEDVAVYIGTWEVKCPNTLCNRYTPLVGNWWLARVKGERYAYMKPKAEGGKVSIEIVEGKSEGAPSPNVRGRPELAECLLCGSRITYIDPETGRVYRSKSEVRNELIKKRLEFYPKYAIRDWNRKLEEYLEGKTLEGLKNALARPRLLVKVKIVGRDLKFEPATEEDNEKLWRALEKLKQIWGDLDIPTEPIPSYESRSIWVYPYGFDKWFKLFNPRQLLTLIKLVKLIREAGKRAEEGKLREGWSKEEAFKYAEAVTTYLAMWLVNYVRYDSMVTCWDATYWGLLKVKQSLSMRGIAMMWNWCEFEPILGTKTFLPYTIDGLSYLVSVVSGSSSRVRVLLDDATVLSKLGNEKFDVIVTDPPYRDDVPYTELSDYYYIWLKRALSDGNLAPRFHADALIYNTQWESFAPKEISYNEGRIKYFKISSAVDYYQWLMSRAFRKMVSIVKDGSLIVTYFAHSSPEAWIELVEAGWRSAGLRVTRAWAIATESAQRVTARGKTALESSIVVVWKKRSEDKVTTVDEVRERARQRAREALEVAERIGLKGLDLFLTVMTACLSEFTSYSRITRFGGELSSEDIVAESYRIAIEVLVGEESRYIKSPEALAYITIRRLFARIPKWDWSLDSQDLITLGYGLYGIRGGKQRERLHEILVRKRVVGVPEKEGRKGAKVAKPKVFTFLSPRDANPDSIKEVLSLRKIDPLVLGVLEKDRTKPLSTSIDILHLLEYAIHRGTDYFKNIYGKLMVKYPTLTEEAVYVAKALSRIPNDPEAYLCKEIIKYIYER